MEIKPQEQEKEQVQQEPSSSTINNGGDQVHEEKADAEKNGAALSDNNEVADSSEPEKEAKADDEQVTSEEDRVEAFSAQIEKLKEDLQRERAEFINYRKRVSQEKTGMEGFIVGRILESALPTLDSFDQLLSSDKASLKDEKQLTNFLQGVELIQKQLIEMFKKHGVEEFNPVNKPFDPGTMEALSFQESQEVKTEIVGEVYQKGYSIKERFLRAARVLVLKPIPKEENQTDAQQNSEVEGDKENDGK